MIINTLLNGYIDIIVKILRMLRINSVDMLGLGISIDLPTASLDDRIKKLESAKQNLIDGLTAIQELEKEAEKNKREANEALIQLEVLKKNKHSLQSELDTISQIIKTDVSTFRKVAGVPTDKQIKKERVYGFLSGIFASIFASVIIYFVSLIFKN